LISLELGNQLLDAREILVRTEMADELGDERGAVKIAIKIEQVRLDHALAGVHRRSCPDVRHRGSTLLALDAGDGGIDPVRERHQMVWRGDICRRETNLAPDLRSVNHGTSHLEPVPHEPGGLFGVAGADELSDLGAAHGHPVNANAIDDVDDRPVLPGDLPQPVRCAFALVTERKVMPDPHFQQRSRVEQEMHELGRRDLRHLAVELQFDHRIRAVTHEVLPASLRREDAAGERLRPKYLDRQWLECQHQQPRAERPGPLPGKSQDVLMPLVDTVERADGRNRRCRREILDPGKDLLHQYAHDSTTTFNGRIDSSPASAVPTPSHLPASSYTRTMPDAPAT